MISVDPVSMKIKDSSNHNKIVLDKEHNQMMENLLDTIMTPLIKSLIIEL